MVPNDALYTCTLSAFFRYLCDHLRCYHGDDPTQRIPHLRDLVSADESCDEVVELAELLLQQGTQKIVVSDLLVPSKARV